MKLRCTWKSGAVARAVAVVAGLLIAATAFTFTPTAPRQDGKDAAGDQSNPIMPALRVDAGRPADGGVAGGGAACGPGAGNCFTAGGNETPGCDNVACCETVCACDPFCCDTEWDAFCASEGFGGSGCGAALLCGNPACGNPGSGSCFTPGGNGTPGCDDDACCETVCACDPFCCDTEWDAFCAGEGFGGSGCGAELLCAGLPCPVGNGDECTGPLPAGDGTVSGDTTDNTGTTGDDTSCAFSDTIDEWYCYIATCTGTATASTCNPGTNYDSTLAVFDGCGGSELACNDDAVGAPPECSLNGLNRKSIISWPVIEGQRYFIRVSGFNLLVGQYELDISVASGPISYFSSPGLAMPDNNPLGVVDFIDVSDSFTIDDINVRVKVTHTFVGDLCCTLTHEDSGTSVILFQRMGDGLNDCHSGGPFGCGQDNMNVILDSESVAGSIENQCVANLMGSFTPEQSLAVFNGLNTASSWRLNIVDNAGGDLGTLDEWELIISGPPCGAGCPQDCVTSATFAPPADGNVDAADLAFLLGAWGPNPGSCADTVSSATFAPPPDGVVDAADLAALLGAWGSPGCQ